MHLFSNSYILFYIALVTVVGSMALWFRDIISEGTYLGNHTMAVQKGLNLGIMLFIISEALFFLAIFWAYFHSALTPTVELGSKWPPMGIECAPSEGVSVLKCSPTSHLYLVLDKCHEYSRITISWWTAEYISDVWFGLPRKDNSVSGNWHAEDNKLDTHNHLQPTGNILSRIYRCYSSIAYHDGSSMMRSQKAGWSPHIKEWASS